jgi:5-methylcytosine-specific restriction endonuclease McrA
MKHHDVLVLNKNYVAVHVIEWQKAMCLLVKEHARALDRDFVSYPFADWREFSINNAEDYQKIKTCTAPIAIPEIIVLMFYNKLPQREVKFSRQSIFARDHYVCQYCQKMFTKDDLTIDHIIPRSKGGATTWDNIVACCVPCNARKADRTLAEARERYPQDGKRWTLKHKPVKPKWLNPATRASSRVYICKSWQHFMKKVDATDDI